MCLGRDVSPIGSIVVRLELLDVLGSPDLGERLQAVNDCKEVLVQHRKLEEHLVQGHEVYQNR